jgi:hypothetical protein
MNLLELVQGQLSDERLARLAAIVGESGVGTRKALAGAALPAVLTGLAVEYSGEAGASRLLELMRAGGHDGSLLPNLDGALAGGAHTDALLSLGKGQIGTILGDRVDAVTELMAADTGIRRSSAGDLLGLLVPVVLGVLGKQLQSGGGAARIAELLAGARPALAAIAAPGLPAALGVANLAVPAPAAAAPRQGAVWPWLIVPAVTLAMFFSLRSCQQNSMGMQAAPIDATGAPVDAAAATTPQTATEAADADGTPVFAPGSSSEAMIIEGGNATTPGAQAAPVPQTAPPPTQADVAATPAPGLPATAAPAAVDSPRADSPKP